jgi:dihydroorotase
LFNAGWQEQLGIGFHDVQWVATGERLTADSFARYRKVGGGVILYMNSEAMVDRAIADPMVMVATDGAISGTGGHPRSAGTYARLLGVYVRERHVLTLMEAVRKSSLAPALRLEGMSAGMKLKGRIRVGADADLDVFDAAGVIDRSTYARPAAYSFGFRYVMVGGRFVVRDGQLDESVLPGRAVRAE